MTIPPKLVSLKKLIAFLQSIGYRLDRVRGSHHRFLKVGSQVPLTLAIHNYTKEVYVSYIEAVLSQEGISLEVFREQCLKIKPKKQK
jgi:predicted RNA binding protein YcfA (HicA-like mRNA interferase family)